MLVKTNHSVLGFPLWVEVDDVNNRRDWDHIKRRVETVMKAALKDVLYLNPHEYKETCQACNGYGVIGTRVNSTTSRQDPCPKCSSKE